MNQNFYLINKKKTFWNNFNSNYLNKVKMKKWRKIIYKKWIRKKNSVKKEKLLKKITLEIEK